MQVNTKQLSGKLVDVHGLLNELFNDDCRPSLRWIRQQQKNRTIPFVKISRRVFFDPIAVREALAAKNIVQSR
ncbi:MAG TPA: hypothetical protein EYQ50_22870 [Verrucomicrobiales bacterium]|nr:hypothetical protein [Verrucomicrobiales bacterium]